MKKTFKFVTPEEAEKFQDFCNDLYEETVITRTEWSGNRVTVFKGKKKK